jgi:hypothetical protein
MPRDMNLVSFTQKNIAKGTKAKKTQIGLIPVSISQITNSSNTEGDKPGSMVPSKHQMHELRLEAAESNTSLTN